MVNYEILEVITMKNALLILSILGLMLLASCTAAVSSQATETAEIPGAAATEPSASVKEKKTMIWLDTPLTDVRTGESFMFSDYAGKTVLVESFATFCPACKKQQQHIKEFHEAVGDSVVSIGLNTDPNEDAELVLSYANNNNFDWTYAVAPNDLTQTLVDEFGTAIVSTPTAPIVMICKDQSSRLLPSGVKNPETLQEEIEKGCNL